MAPRDRFVRGTCYLHLLVIQFAAMTLQARVRPEEASLCQVSLCWRVGRRRRTVVCDPLPVYFAQHSTSMAPPERRSLDVNAGASSGGLGKYRTEITERDPAIDQQRLAGHVP